LRDGLLNRMQLLGDVEARPLLFDHVDDAAQTALRAAQPLDDLRMALVDRVLTYRLYTILPERILKQEFWASPNSLDNKQ
jgi:hypothetical protein